MQRLIQVARHIQSSTNGKKLIQVNHGPIEELMIHRPDKLNCITVYILKHFNEIFAEWEKRPELKYVIFKKKEGKAFCAGGDVSLFLSHQTLCGFLLNNILYKFKNLKTPHVISIWDGIVMGGGVGLVQYNPIKIATEN